MLKTKNEFSWNRSQSAIPEGIIIPAGTRVVKQEGEYFIPASHFPINSMERHDATYYGCRVKADNVVEEEECK